ncbi:MAG TPA: hypothetical protein VNN22_02870 [Verrucomicrobiae bacterium]|nr:hypothetical protein [Verrucomicrobiae bacterium]
MNNVEAKLVLQAYRPDGKDASDPFFREALEQAERDPELKRWFAKEMALDANVLSRLQTALPLPHNLKVNLLALQKLERPIPWWLSLVRLTTATAVVTLGIFVGFMLFRSQGKSLDSFQQAMTHFSLQHQGHVTYEPRDLSKIEGWLQGNGVATNFDLPPELQAIGAQGCRVIDWNQQKVTMICFVSKNRDQHLDLFIMDNTERFFPHENESPHFAIRNGLVTASWARNGKLYLLAGENRESVQDVLQSI